jgi:hypothetical protein
MAATVQVGTILVADDSPFVPQILALDGKAYLENWNVVKSLSGIALDRLIRDAGYNFFFLAGEVNAMFFGTVGAQRIQNALKRILTKVRGGHFNCLEVTGITPKRCLGLHYTIVSAHSRHIQRSCQLDSIEQRQAASRDAKWARG